jgi:hypothetical protein
VVVWVMPACVAFATVLAVNWLGEHFGGSSGFWLLSWGGFNFATTYGLGVLDGRLRRSAVPPDEVFPPRAQFLLLQLGLVPALLLGMAGIRLLFE